MFLWAQQDKHGTPGRDEWTESTGLGIAVAGGLESAAIRPAGLSQRRSGRLESAAGRRALSQRRAGGHWIRGDPAAIIWGSCGRRVGFPHDPAATIWGSRGRRVGFPRERRAGCERRGWEPRTAAWSPAIRGLEGATDSGRLLPRSAGMRARDQWTRGTRGDPAELPRPLAVGYGGITSGDFLAAGQTHRNQNKDFRKKRKTKRGEWAPLTVRSGLLSRCTHEGGTGTRRRGRKLK